MDSELENKEIHSGLDGCRIYLCKAYFGGTYTCKFFYNIKEYNGWLKKPTNNEKIDNTTIVPVCSPIHFMAFDKCYLYLKNKGLL